MSTVTSGRGDMVIVIPSAALLDCASRVLGDAIDPCKSTKTDGIDAYP